MQTCITTLRLLTAPNWALVCLFHQKQTLLELLGKYWCVAKLTEGTASHQSSRPSRHHRTHLRCALGSIILKSDLKADYNAKKRSTLPFTLTIHRSSSCFLSGHSKRLSLVLQGSHNKQLPTWVGLLGDSLWISDPNLLAEVSVWGAWRQLPPRKNTSKSQEKFLPTIAISYPQLQTQVKPFRKCDSEKDLRGQWLPPERQK